MSRFWRPKAAGEWIDIAVALLGWPAGVAVCASWYTIRNGTVVAKRFGRSRLKQLGDQLRLAVTLPNRHHS